LSLFWLFYSSSSERLKEKMFLLDHFLSFFSGFFVKMRKVREHCGNGNFLSIFRQKEGFFFVATHHNKPFFLLPICQKDRNLIDRKLRI
jgi:hypothetical protein